MINRETPLAEIVGQMSLSKNTVVSTQSWVFISVNVELTKRLYFLTTTSVQRFQLVEFPYRS